MKLIRILITLIAVGFLIWFIAPAMYGIFNIGNIAGIIICCCIIFRSGFAGAYKHIKKLMTKRLPTKILLRTVQTAASVFIIYAVIVSAFMVHAMLSKPVDGSTAVVLGAEVKPWGPSVLLRQRIDAAESYMKDNPETRAVVTGGKGSNEVMSEGQCMFDEMTADGIASERIYIEDKAENTDQNIRYSVKIIEDNSLDKNIAVVTDSYHQLRARIIANKINPDIKTGAINTQNNKIGLTAYPTYFVREWIAIPVEIIK